MRLELRIRYLIIIKSIILLALFSSDLSVFSAVFPSYLMVEPAGGSSSLVSKITSVGEEVVGCRWELDARNCNREHKIKNKETQLHYRELQDYEWNCKNKKNNNCLRSVAESFTKILK